MPTSGHIDLPLQGGGGGESSNSFATIQPPNGTSPTATSPTDILNVTSSDASITITGYSTTKTVDFKAGGGKSACRPPVQALDNYSYSLPTGSAYTVDTYTVVNGDRVLFIQINSGEVYVAGGVGTSLTWTLATDGQNGDGTPATGDFLEVVHGNIFRVMRLTYSLGDASGYVLPGWNNALVFSRGAVIREVPNYGYAVGSAGLQILTTYSLDLLIAGGGGQLRVFGSSSSLHNNNYGNTSGQAIYQTMTPGQTTTTTTDATPTGLSFSYDTNYADNMLIAQTHSRPYKVEFDVLAVRTDVADTDYFAATYSQFFYINSSGARAALGSPTAVGTPFRTSGASSWNAVLSSDGLYLNVTGATGQTVSWSAVMRFTGMNS